MRVGDDRRAQEGFTYVAVLVAVTIVGVILATTGEVWSQSRQREKEQELLFVGDQFRQAIALYYQRTPGAGKRYPERLEDLLEDKRYLTNQRYLRKIFRDPMTGKPDWGLVLAPEGGIMGVHSLAGARPIKQGNFRERDQTFAGANIYSEWRFVYEPPRASATPALPASRIPSDIRGISADGMNRTSGPVQ